MSLSQAETRLLQQLRDDVDRLIANGRGDSRTARTRGEGTTVLKAYKASNGFIVGNGVYLDYADNTWKKINGTSFAYEDYLWGIVSFKIDVNKFSVVVNGEVRVPGSSFTIGAPYGFDANGVLSASAARPVVKATLGDAILVGASVGGSDAAITADINHTAHGFTVGTFLYRDDTTGLYARTDNTDPLKCDVRGWVSTVIDANNFTLTMEGWKIGVGGSTATLYLSTTGGLTTSVPVSGSVIPVLYPVSRGGSFDAYFSAINIVRPGGKACSIVGRNTNSAGILADIQASDDGMILHRFGDVVEFTTTPRVKRSGVTFNGCFVNQFTTSTTPPTAAASKGDMHFIY